MMNRDIVEQFLSAIEKNDFKKAEGLLSEDFKFTGITPEPLGSKEYLNVHKALNKGMPDFKFNANFIKQTPDVIEISVRLTGTHKNEMPSPIPEIKNIPATDKYIKLPEERIDIKLKNEKIENINVEKVPGGGIFGILKQLGVSLPEEVHPM
ncbi:MAG TPA: nuclear transport factor 2 family protein [Ignavibacteriaceae bacterium]|nr:nuclear transport factor 2 family protein [Ignavibacteriaceae bacterium]